MVFRFFGYALSAFQCAAMAGLVAPEMNQTVLGMSIVKAHTPSTAQPTQVPYHGALGLYHVPRCFGAHACTFSATDLGCPWQNTPLGHTPTHARNAQQVPHQGQHSTDTRVCVI